MNGPGQPPGLHRWPQWATSRPKNPFLALIWLVTPRSPRKGTRAPLAIHSYRYQTATVGLTGGTSRGCGNGILWPRGARSIPTPQRIGTRGFQAFPGKGPIVDELLKMAMQQFGINQNQGTSLLASLFKMLKAFLGNDFGKLTNAIPGANDWLGKPEVTSAQQQSGSGGGILAAILGMFLGAKGKATAEWTNSVKKSGLDLSQVTPFLKMVLQFFQKFMDAKQLKSLLGNVPQINKLLD